MYLLPHVALIDVRKLSCLQMKNSICTKVLIMTLKFWYDESRCCHELKLLLLLLISYYKIFIIIFSLQGRLLHVWIEMAVNISGIRRNIKNVAHNYTDAQVKHFSKENKLFRSLLQTLYVIVNSRHDFYWQSFVPLEEGSNVTRCCRLIKVK